MLIPLPNSFRRASRVPGGRLGCQEGVLAEPHKEPHKEPHTESHSVCRIPPSSLRIAIAISLGCPDLYTFRSSLIIANVEGSMKGSLLSLLSSRCEHRSNKKGCLRGPIWVAFWPQFDLIMEVSEPIFTQIPLKFTLLTFVSSF